MSKETLLLTVLLTYIVLITGFSVWLLKRIKTATDFLLGSRDIGVFVLAGSTLATIIGTGATIGATGYAYQHGFAGCLYGLGQGTGIILVGLSFAKMRRYRFMTLGEEVACYYGGTPIVYHFANITMFFSLVCWTSVQVMGAANYLGILLGASYGTSVVLTGAAFATLTIIGGYVAVVYTDTIQAFILLIGFTTLAWLALDQVGGWSALRLQTPERYWSFFGVDSVGWGSVVGIPLALMLSYITEPAYRHRIYSARSERQAMWSMIVPGLLVLPFTVLIAILGMSSHALNADLGVPDRALPWLAISILPVWATAVLVVSGFAATFSSGNSDAASGAVFFVRHIYKLLTGRHPRHPLRASRITVGLMIVAATFLAAQFTSIVQFIVVFISVLGSGLSVVILLGRFWGRATWQGALSAIGAGAVISVLVMILPSQKALWQEPILPATLGALLAHVVVSLATAAAKPSLDEVAALLEREREEVDQPSEVFLERFTTGKTEGSGPSISQ